MSFGLFPAPHRAMPSVAPPCWSQHSQTLSGEKTAPAERDDAIGPDPFGRITEDLLLRSEYACDAPKTTIALRGEAIGECIHRHPFQRRSGNTRTENTVDPAVQTSWRCPHHPTWSNPILYAAAIPGGAVAREQFIAGIPIYRSRGLNRTEMTLLPGCNRVVEGTRVWKGKDDRDLYGFLISGQRP
jgi:hypothetical protein